ncbi:hypothetical protein [Amycolatopsis sp. TNS106]|uniref:hypothetical protein n=1 Tax=Amycolatopsis sp. TNS106 TaxID=2861750 RepID=UPI001C59B22B|nr:hypothetical protein [Amycolatopsis sp. TNS106]
MPQRHTPQVQLTGTEAAAYVDQNEYEELTARGREDAAQVRTSPLIEITPEPGA